MKSIERLNGGLIALFFLLNFLSQAARAVAPDPGDTNSTSIYPLNSWSFYDTNYWTSDLGYAPMSSANLSWTPLGNGSAVVIDTNIPAWLQYNVYEADGTTNLTVDNGSVTFWFAPNWSSTNDVHGGLGPQQWGRLLEVGAYTTNASYGWWSLYVDPAGANLYFAAQTNNGSSYFLSTPIDWTTNRWHFIALTYCVTNTALYLDGALATNGTGLAFWPGWNVLTNGFFLGSDSSSGSAQAHGWFDDLKTYNVPLDADTVNWSFFSGSMVYYINPANPGNLSANISSAPSSPGITTTYNAITGIGGLQLVGAASSCVTSTNVWLTNVVATAAGNGTMNLTFTIEGGSDGLPYDVFANSVLGFGNGSFPWAWMGQGYHCNIYTLTNFTSSAVFLILGKPIDTDHDGLTDAFEKLTSHTDPNNYDSDGDGILDSDEILNHTDPLTPNPAFPASLNIQTCPQ